MCVLLNTSIGIQLIYNFELVSAVQRQSAVCVCVCIPFLFSLPPAPSFQSSRSSQSTELSSLCYKAASC